MEVIILRGIPGCGKSTWVKNFKKVHRDYVVISRDAIREMLHDHSNSPQTEAIVTKFYNKLFKEALENKLNIILDNTHIKQSYINDALKMIESVNSDYNVELLQFEYNLKTCIERDSKRERVVGREVIERMEAGLKSNPEKNIQKLINEWKARVRSKPKGLMVEWVSGRDNCIICDIDGTLAHMNGKRGPYDWKQVGVDDIDVYVRDVLLTYDYMNQLNIDSIAIILVSGRDSVCRKETEEWLKLHKVPYHALYMRPENDQRKDYIIKEEIYNEHIKEKYNVRFVLDDRRSVVLKWRELGLKCFQVQDGDF